MDRSRLSVRIDRLSKITRLTKRARKSCVGCLPAVVFLAVTAGSFCGPPASAQGQGKSGLPRGRRHPRVHIQSGAAVAQPDLSFALPNGATEGAVEQTFRLIVKPDLWGSIVRLRFSNNFGSQPVTLGGVKVGLQNYAGNIVPGTSSTVTFKGQKSVTLPLNQEIYSDPIVLGFSSRIENLIDSILGESSGPGLRGRKLAVSIYVRGTSGMLTWHAKGMTTSYITPPGSGDHSGDIDDSAYPFSTTSWY